MGVLNSEKVTYTGLYPHNVIDGNFNGYIRQIPLRDTPWRPMDQLWFFSYCQKQPILGPKIGPNGPKKPKLHFATMQGVIFNYFSVLSSSVMFILLIFHEK